MIIGFFASETIIGLFNSDTEVIRLGSDYLRISIFSYFVSALSFVYAGALRSIGNSALPMWGSLVGLVINGVLNAILIFGLLGAPALGVSGAAIATLIARIVECLIILTVVTLKVKPLRLSSKDFKHIEIPMVKLPLSKQLYQCFK